MNPESRFQTCKRCLYTSNHPLGITFDADGICSGCRIHEEKDFIDWDARWDELQALIKPYRSIDSRNYDCVVPVSGAGDSFYILHLVKHRLGLNPLLVSYNRYYNTPLGIRNLAQLRTQFDCDILIQNINPVSVKRVVRTTLRSLGSLHWPVLAGQTSFPVQVAVTHKIPLVIWGAHQGIEQVGMYSHLHNVEMTRRYRKDHDLMGLEADDLISMFDTLRESDIWQYRYPDFHAIQSVGVRGIYLGNYVRWDPLQQHKSMVELYDYHSSQFSRTFDIFDHVDDWNYMYIHDLIKFLKHGYSKVLDHCCREIRHVRLDRDSALKIVQHYQIQDPYKHSKLLLSWLDLSMDSLLFVLKEHSRYPIPDSFEDIISLNHMTAHLHLNPNDSLAQGGLEKMIIYGKGLP